MQWLSFSDSQRHGIDVRSFDLTSPVSRNSPTASNTSDSSASVVKTEVYKFVEATNRRDDQSLQYLQGKYRDEVGYFGKIRTKIEVLNDKRTFFKRWPNRNYSIEPDSVQVSCTDEANCRADGIVRWEVSNSIANSIGSAKLSMDWTFEGTTWKIGSEKSQIVARNISSVSGPDSGIDRARTGTNIAQPKYRLDPTQRKVVSLSNLYLLQDCATTGRSIGKIVKRDFTPDGLKIAGVLIELSDGSREFVNVDVDLDKSDMVTKGWVTQGLQTLLTEGKSVEIDVRLCGAAGRVQMIDAVRERSH